MFALSLNQWFLALSLALLIGASKGGLPGVGVLVVPLMASLFPAKASTGILLPMLLMADCFAVIYYHRFADWKLLRQLLPSTVCGICIAFFIMNHLNDQDVRRCIGIIIIMMVVVLTAREFGYLKKDLPTHASFVWAIGISVGLTTMLANAAGPIAGLYLIALGMDKQEFIGTRAWFFLLINSIKIPFSYGLGLISSSSLFFNIQCLPIIILGVFIGILLVKKISPKIFARSVIALAALSALNML